ncbi:MAG TPA: LD-carboxypeptidase [Alphaproteobacteria bacterium]|nr:LD-carboxypeptidase [Alphaproteobacteria bacterium]
MPDTKPEPRAIRIGIAAPASRLDPALADRVSALAAARYPGGAVELVFHPQCFLTSGHFAGADAARAAAFLEIANDPGFDALWFARGGYGSCRLAEDVLSKLEPAARTKSYLGYSDAGSLLAGLYALGFQTLAHGPMPSDIRREGGETAVVRALAWLVTRDPDALEASVGADKKTAAFNITILSHLLGTGLQPDLAGHVLMLEETEEQMYRIDRALFHITSNPGIRKAAGIRLGRCSEILPNDPDFVLGEEDVVTYWCEKSGIPYLGRADIGHDIENKVVPFGALPAS